MSRELKRRWPNLIELIEAEHANHTSILDNIEHYLADDLPQPIGSLDNLISRARARHQTPAVQTDNTTSQTQPRP